ncbi:MAG: hypothetical protein KF775_08180 [Cyclobacteriaceae bacterium]|nr:hypothetical protein [Cyclobacteriaceae bacterium]
MDILFIYVFICAISAGAAAKKGWNLWDSFLLAFILSPAMIARRFFRVAD